MRGMLLGAVSILLKKMAAEQPRPPIIFVRINEENRDTWMGPSFHTTTKNACKGLDMEINDM
jgi:hypothetical protein